MITEEKNTFNNVTVQLGASIRFNLHLSPETDFLLFTDGDCGIKNIILSFSRGAACLVGLICHTGTPYIKKDSDTRLKYLC
jgi:hypothetical protein